MTPGDPHADSSNNQLMVLVFGPQSQTVGLDRLPVACGSLPISASDLMKQIATQHPQLEPSLGVSRLAVNHEFADDNMLIGQDVEVALVGLISGG
ncbi:hypothetical protein SAMN06265222_10272 [Neorhodopirellula lusitana]|uniref:Molybdopterin synthase sulfur carrier subunit n=1 Tax=Neorhodopirellula lusitana TaxID=445327 RepID=A0ABY1PXE3_9BACT|nr:MoaD/ThiS family protein [Neorhodopirellula lusitana]SMP46147.1 hypothetical protein SAMN06265222_10272 [Neorhodopirellula lusitana]